MLVEKKPILRWAESSTATKYPRYPRHNTEYRGFTAKSDAVVQFEFNRVRSHAYAVVFFNTQGDVSIDSVVGEHAASRQELTVSVQRVQCFFQRACNLWDLFRFFRRQVVQVLSIASPGWILFLIPSRPAISSAAKHRYGLAAGSGKRTSIRRAFGEVTTGIRMEAERLRAE